VLVFPGISLLPMTVVPFFAAIAVWTATLAGVALVAVAADWPHSHNRGHALFGALTDPFSLAALCALVIAAVLVTSPPATSSALRETLAIASGILATLFTAAAVAAHLAHPPLFIFRGTPDNRAALRRRTASSPRATIRP